MFNTAKVAHFYGFPSPQGQKSATSLPVFIVYSGLYKTEVQEVLEQGNMVNI